MQEAHLNLSTDICEDREHIYEDEEHTLARVRCVPSCLVQEAHLNLSTDMLCHVARAFMREMGQPYSAGDIGKSLLTEAQVRLLISSFDPDAEIHVALKLTPDLCSSRCQPAISASRSSLWPMIGCSSRPRDPDAQILKPGS